MDSQSELRGLHGIPQVGANRNVRPPHPSTSQTIKQSSKKGVKDFEFGRVLGEGSYSTVVAATDRVSGREYAVKILDKRHIIKEKKVKYVNIEKNTLNRLGSHPGIVRLYYTFQDEQSLYYVLDLAAEGELLGVLKRLGSFDEACTRFYASQILDAVEYMHSRGIIHRDLKPENVLLTDSMHVKITDFGTAKILDDDTETPDLQDNVIVGIPLAAQHDSQTLPLRAGDRAVSFVGTAEYVSPELLKDKHAGKSSDLWAFGCILYQMLSGRPPFKASNEYLTFQKIVGLQYDFPSGFPPVARDLIERLLVLDPARRLPVEHIKNHQFFDDVRWGSNLWRQKPPKLKRFVPSMQSPLIQLGGSSSNAEVVESGMNGSGPRTTQSISRPQRSTTELAPPSSLDLEWSTVLSYPDERILKLGNLTVSSTSLPHDSATSGGSHGSMENATARDTVFSRLFGNSGPRKRNRLVLVTNGGRIIVADTNTNDKRIKTEISLLADSVSWQMCQDGKGGTSWRVILRDKCLTFEDVRASSPQWTQEWLDALQKSREAAVLRRARVLPEKTDDVMQEPDIIGNGAGRAHETESYVTQASRHHLTKGNPSMADGESLRGKKRFSRRQSKSILAAVF